MNLLSRVLLFVPWVLVLDIIKDYIDRKAVEHIVVARES
jgi:hypothetical protein